MFLYIKDGMLYTRKAEHLVIQDIPQFDYYCIISFAVPMFLPLIRG